MQSVNRPNSDPLFTTLLCQWVKENQKAKKRIVVSLVPRVHTASAEGVRGKQLVETAASLGIPMVTFALLGQGNLKESLEGFPGYVRIPLRRRGLSVSLWGGWVEEKNPVVFLGNPSTILGEPQPLASKDTPWQQDGEAAWALDVPTMLRQAMILGLGPIQILNNLGLLDKMAHFYLADPLAALSMFRWIQHDPNENKGEIKTTTGEITDIGIDNLRKYFSVSVGQHAFSVVPREPVSLALAGDLFTDPLLLKAFSRYGMNGTNITLEGLVAHLLGISATRLPQGNVVVLDGQEDTLSRAYECHWRNNWLDFAGVGERASVDEVGALFSHIATASAAIANANSLAEVNRGLAYHLLSVLGANRMNYYQVRGEAEIKIVNQWKIEADGKLVERGEGQLGGSHFTAWVGIENFGEEIMGKLFRNRDQGWQAIFDPQSRQDCLKGGEAAPDYPFALFPVTLPNQAGGPRSLVGVIKLDFSVKSSFRVAKEQIAFITTLINFASQQIVKFL